MQLIYFDGVCNLCNGTVAFLIKRDKQKKFKFASLQSQSGEQVLLQLKLKSGVYKTIIYNRNGKFYFKSTAVLYILKDLGGYWKSAFALIIIPAFLRDIVYMLVSKTRYRIFGKRSTCMVPTSDIKERFLV